MTENCNIIGGTHLDITLTPKGGQQVTKTIDLQLYKRQDLPELHGYEFCYLMGFDISSFDTDSDEYKSLRQFLLRFEETMVTWPYKGITPPSQPKLP